MPGSQRASTRRPDGGPPAAALKPAAPDADGTGVIATLVVLCTMLPRPQEPTLRQPQQPPKPQSGTRLGVQVDAGGWPVVVEPPPRLDDGPAATGAAAPAAGGAAPGIGTPATAAPGHADGAATAGAAGGAPGAAVRGFDVPSPFPAVLRTVGAPEAFAALGGVTVRWRVTVHGPQGEVLGSRELVHRADATTGDRDRLEDAADALVRGRLGATVFVQQNRVPWPTRVEAARHELDLFGLHLRLPWAFADPQEFVETGASAPDAQGLVRLGFARRRHGGGYGPTPAAEPTDRFELLVPGDGGPPRELVHDLQASGGARRRVLLDDWRRVGDAVQLPFRRVYVDDAGRPTTTLQILQVDVLGTVADRDFRLQ